MILDTTSSKVQARLAYPVASVELSFVASYADVTTTTSTTDTSCITSNGTSQVDVVGSPAASTQRVVKYISIHNGDTKTAVVHVRHFDGSNGREEVSLGLAPGDTAVYMKGFDWVVSDKYGNVRGGNTVTYPYGSIRRVPGQSTNASTRAPATGNTYALYMGPADKDYSQVKVAWKVTTLGSGITWAEVAVATGAFVHNGNATLTTLGFTDVSGDVTSTGAKLTTITGLSGKLDDEVWVLIGYAGSSLVLRGGTADVAQTGSQQIAAATRPSTMAANTAFTLEGGTTVPFQVAIQFL